MRKFILLVSALLLIGTAGKLSAATPPVGGKALDFTLSTVEGKSVHLADMIAKGSVVLVVLRGYPGYQCPFCNLQAHDFISHAQEFASAGAQVVLVYPGPPGNLDMRATEFLADKQLPANFVMLLDPGYRFTNLYGLRWDAPNETAYPSTFVIDHAGTIIYSKSVRMHSGRATAAEVLGVLPKKKAAPPAN